MGETAEPVAAIDLADGWLRFWRPCLRWLELEGAVRPLAVVVVDVDSQHVFEVTAVQDQQPVKTLGAHGPDESFGNRVRLRRAHRRLQDANAFAAKDLVEGSAVLAVGAVYRVGRQIFLVRAGGTPTRVWKASAELIGLSIEGRRIAWAENIKGRGRILAVTLRSVR